MDIERLTARNKNGLAYLVNVKPDEQEVDSPYKNTLKCILDCFERLAQYEEAEIAKQSVVAESATSEEVQFEINRLKEVLKQTKEAADELKGKKYAVNMKPVYDQIKSLELQITALQEYQPSDEGRFPDEAEREYNANYEAKCKKTGINLLAEPTDEAVQRARQWFWDEFLTGHMCIPEEAKTILSVLDNLRQMRSEQPPCVNRLSCWYCTSIELHNIKSVKTVTDEFDRELGAYDTPYNFCPNCGRRLEADT